MKKDDILALITRHIEGQGSQVDISGILPKILKETLNKATLPYISLERLRPYLYRVTYDSIPTDNGIEPTFGGCSSYVSEGKLYRNLDFFYDNAASFIVRTHDFEGMSFVTGLNDGSISEQDLGQLPYVVVDGRNNDGIMVSCHVLYNDWEWKGCGDKSIPLTRLPYLALTKVKSMATIESDLSGVLDNLAITPNLEATEYLIQVLVTDGTTSYALLPPTESGLPYVLQDITSNPKLSNFRWVEDAIVNRVNLQRRPTGVERFNLMPCPLESLRFTKAYESADRLSEFIGLRDTTKDSSDAELVDIFNVAKGIYEHRERNGETWHTMHSVVYGEKMESLFVQENWVDNCVVGVDSQIGGLADLDTDHKSDLVSAINEIANVVETPHYVISFAKSSAEMKQIYDECSANLILAKNIVFYNAEDNLYYRVNGYNMINGALKLHAIIGSVDVTINLASNGSLSVG